MSNNESRYYVTLILASAAVAAGLSTARADTNTPPQIPTCEKKIGTLAVTEPENPWWTRPQR
jgi:ABC-type sugar transport system substrate-binding protein